MTYLADEQYKKSTHFLILNYKDALVWLPSAELGRIFVHSRLLLLIGGLHLIVLLEP